MKGKKGKQAQPVHMSALVQYITQTQQSFEWKIATAQTEEERRYQRQACEVSLWEADAAHKYKLTPSALAMIARLMPEPGSGQGIIETLPGTGIWMMLDDERLTNVYFSCLSHAAASYLELHPRIKPHPELERLAGRPWLWDIEVIAIEKRPLSYLYDVNRRRWTLNNFDQCPVHLCERLGFDRATGFPSWYICDECRPAFQYWLSWFPVALMAVNGDFAETEERQKPATFTERELRKVEHHKPGPDTIPILHTYHIITFDMTVKKHLAPQESSDQEAPRAEHQIQHPTWLEQAIEANTVLYVSKHINSVQRTFKHERYVNMRGKTIDVRAYDKRVPMSVKRLQQTIYQAIAGSEEGDKSSQRHQ